MPYVMINGLKQEFETFGDIHNPPLLLLYGSATLPQGWRSWEYNGALERLAKENYVIAYDRRGHGQSRFLPGNTLEDIANDIVALLDLLCIDKVNVAGLSAGTYILGCAAGIAPERFKSMILIVGNSHTSGGSPATHLAFKMGINPATATKEDIARVARANYAPATTDEMIAAHMAWEGQFDSYPKLPMEDTMAMFKAISEFDFRENYSKLKMPVLVISGQNDLINPPERGREIASLVDGGRFVEIPDSGHMLFNEKNEECVDAMLDFLRSVN